jgi:hypothetical protein
VTPISEIWMKLLGETVKFLISQRTRTATSASPTAEIGLGRGIRLASVGAEASAATFRATLTTAQANVLPDWKLLSERRYDRNRGPKWRNW